MKVSKGYKQTEAGIIPDDWGNITVRSIAAPIRNAIVGGPFGSDLVSNDYVSDGIPVIRGQNMGDRWVTGPFVFVTKEKATNLAANLAHPDDLVFTQRGTMGQVCIVPTNNYASYLISQSQMKVTLNRNIADPSFYYYMFSSNRIQKYIQQSTIQTSLPHINLGILREIPIPLPSLVEQRTIAAALSDVDSLLSALSALLAKKHLIKQGAMQELLTGRKRLSGFGDVWEVSNLKKVADIQAGINKPLSFMGSGTLYVTVQDLYEGTFIPTQELGRIQLNSKEIEAKSLIKGDIVFGKSSVKRDGIGYPSQFIGWDEPVVFSGFTFCARARKEIVNSIFLFYVLRWHKTRRWLIDNSQASALTNINQLIANNIPVSYPSLKEQTAITEILSDMDAEIAALEQRREKTRLLKQGMMQELLTGRIRLI